MQTRILIILIAFIVLTAPARAQNSQGSLDYVAGETYKITNQNGGFTVEWAGAEAPPEQLNYVSDSELRVLTPNGKERLVILIKEDGRFSEVIDLKYQRRSAGELRKTELAKRPKKQLFTFENGLEITISNGEADARLGDRTLEVTGGNGRWRVITDAFEAGVAYGPKDSDKAYTYFTKK